MASSPPRWVRGYAVKPRAGMDAADSGWYKSNMDRTDAIPVFALFGETDPFPDVVHCEHLSVRAPANGWRISPHRHAQMAQVFLIGEGQAEATVDGTAWPLTCGDFLFVPAQKVHAFRFEPGTEGQVISFPLSVVATAGPGAGEILAALSRPVAGRSDLHLRTLAELVAQTLARPGPFRAQRAAGLAHSVLGLIAEAAQAEAPAAQGPASARMQVLDRLIAEHMGAGWSAADYAAALCISTGHLSRICRQNAGLGASAYIAQAVMEEACRLLAFTQLTVSEIGYRLGFSDPSHFSKRFRAARRETPSQYRARFTG